MFRVKAVINRLFLYIGLVFGLVIPFPAFSDTAINIDFPESDPVNLGSGWDLDLIEKKFRTCIVFKSDQRNYNNTKLTYERSIDNESLARALDISGSASFKSISGNFSVSSSFAKDTSFTSSSTYMSVLAEVLLGPEYVIAEETSGAVKLTAPMLVLAKSDPAEFYRQCGTGFVSVIQSGAKLTGIVEFKGTTQEEKEQISLTASSGSLTGGFDMSANSMMRKFQSTDRFKMNAVRAGGDGKSISLTLEDLNKEIINLPSQAASGPKAFRMIVEPYQNLPDWPGVPIVIDISDREILARAYGRLYTVWGYASEALDKRNGGWFLRYDADRTQIAKLLEDIQANLEEIRTLAKTCSTSNPCNIGSWRNWDDLEYRSRLPLRGSFSDLGINPEGTNLNLLAGNLANQRVGQWIDEVINIRCKKYAECTAPSRVNQLTNAIVKRIESVLRF
jgi:hypothetical protein